MRYSFLSPELCIDIEEKIALELNEKGYEQLPIPKDLVETILKFPPRTQKRNLQYWKEQFTEIAHDTDGDSI